MAEYNGLEELASAILRTAYNDMLTAYLADAAHRFRSYSYNCHVYYTWLQTGRGKYGINERAGKKAKADADRLTQWFRTSQRCKSLCKKVEGEWFVEQVKKHVKSFALDEKPEWMIKPTLTIGDTDSDRKKAEKKIALWKTKRDEWRKEHGLKEVD